MPSVIFVDQQLVKYIKETMTSHTLEKFDKEIYHHLLMWWQISTRKKQKFKFKRARAQGKQLIWVRSVRKPLKQEKNKKKTHGHLFFLILLSFFVIYPGAPSISFWGSSIMTHRQYITWQWGLWVSSNNKRRPDIGWKEKKRRRESFGHFTFLTKQMTCSNGEMAW